MKGIPVSQLDEQTRRRLPREVQQKIRRSSGSRGVVIRIAAAVLLAAGKETEEISLQRRAIKQALRWIGGN